MGSVMIKPLYVPFLADAGIPATGKGFMRWANAQPWTAQTASRQECFMSREGDLKYTYGTEPWERTYTSVPFTKEVLQIQGEVNAYLREVNVCFLNRYNDRWHQLGWHADETDIVVVVSLGQKREIWWRPTGLKGVTPPERRQLLALLHAFGHARGVGASHPPRVLRDGLPREPDLSPH